MENISNNFSSENKRKLFNPISLLIIINFFVTPIIFAIIFTQIFKSYSFEIFTFIYGTNESMALSNIQRYHDFVISAGYYVIFFSTLASLIFAMILSKKIKEDYSDCSLWKKVLLGIGLGILTIFCSYIIQYIAYLLGLNFESQNTAKAIEMVKINRMILFNIIIFAPIGEEIVFKKGIFRLLHDIFTSSASQGN